MSLSDWRNLESIRPNIRLLAQRPRPHPYTPGPRAITGQTVATQSRAVSGFRLFAQSGLPCPCRHLIARVTFDSKVKMCRKSVQSRDDLDIGFLGRRGDGRACAVLCVPLR